MQSTDVMIGPLTERTIWQGALFWALALYIPLSRPLARLDESLQQNGLADQWRQISLIGSSLLLAVAVGLVVQLLFSWMLGPSWASSLALIAIGWSLLLLLSSSAKGEG